MQLGLFGIIATVLIVVPLWRICARAGFNGALSIFALIPWLGIPIVGAILSFRGWPAQPNSIEEQN